MKMYTVTFEIETEIDNPDVIEVMVDKALCTLPTSPYIEFSNVIAEFEGDDDEED